MSQNNYFLGFSDIARLERNQCHDNAKEFMSFIWEKNVSENMVRLIQN